MKKLITIAAVMMAAIFAKADTYLYWTVDMDEAAKFGAYYAVLEGYDGSGYVSIGNPLIINGGGKDANVDAYTSYLVRLFNASRTEVAYLSEPLLAGSDALKAYLYQGGAMAERPANPYSFSGFVVPEPTSGLLLLLGMGALALKRKHV